MPIERKEWYWWERLLYKSINTKTIFLAYASYIYEIIDIKNIVSDRSEKLNKNENFELLTRSSYEKVNVSKEKAEKYSIN